MSTIIQSRAQREYVPRQATEGPDPGHLEGFGAGSRLAVDDIPDTDNRRRFDEYMPAIEALTELNGKWRTAYIKGDWGRATIDEDRFWSDLDDMRHRKPGALSGFPATRKAFDEQFRGRIEARQARDQGIAARAPAAATLAGGVVGTMLDPYNIVSLPVSFGGNTILSVAAREAAGNMLMEGLETPMIQRERRETGRPEMSAGEVAISVGMAGAGGFVLGGGGKAIEVGAPKAVASLRQRFERYVAANWEKLPAGLREKWGSAAKVDDRALAEVFEALVGRENLSVDERAALTGLRRETEVEAANPFNDDFEGNDAHQTLLASNLARVEAEILGLKLQARVEARARIAGETALSSGTVRVPGRPSQVGYANDVYQFFRSKGLSDAQARGIAAGIHAESGSDHGIRGGHKGRALGLGQWLGPRRAKLIARYGENPTRAQQLEYLWEELNGGDAGGRAVLNAGDEVGVLDAYIRKFMRPAPGAETVGDLTRGMQALGRGGEDLTISERAGGEADPEAAALAARGAELDAERAALDAERAARGDGGGADGDGPQLWDDSEGRFVDEWSVAPMPELRREDFPDETSWRIAQAAVDAEALGMPAPAVTRQSVWEDARDSLIEARDGEVPGALFHRDVGPIDVKYGVAPRKGEPGYGLAKIAAKHPEVMGDLPAILDSMAVKSRSDNRIVLESADHKAVVRLDYDGKAQTWLLSAYERKGKAPPRRTTDVPGNEARDGSPARGAGGDIAETAAKGNAAAPTIGTGPRDEALPFDALWSDDGAPRDAGGLTANERASVDYEEPGLATYSDPEGAGAKLDLDEGRHDLQAEIDSDAALGKVTFAAADGADATIGDVLKDIDGEEAALKALRDCL